VKRVLDYAQLAPQKGITYSRDHLRRKVKDGSFPPPIKLSERRIAWPEDVIDAWLDERPPAA
jgi:predicted DNA-binding transcriptional regulator AlpA